jgi:elongation factor P--(R)-beta-lysine ligase
MNLEPIFIREKIIKTCRAFFDEQGFHEVITPTLNNSLPLEPNLYSFTTQWNTIHGSKDLYLSTSPESGLKKMMAEGIGNCYAISKSFRNLEQSGNQHNPEFLMLEWYRENATYHDIMKDTQDLMIHIGFPPTEWQTFSLPQLFKEYAEIPSHILFDDQQFYATAEKKGYNTTNASWGELFDQIFLNEIEPKLPSTPFFLTDFPARTSPLCTSQKENPQLAERFEVYMSGIEVGNGNTENTNAQKILSHFQEEEQKRKAKGLPTHPIDMEFVNTLQKLNGKSIAGIGMGIDRIAMILSNSEKISDVEPFTLC